jgi:hypothetical protein
LAAVEVAVIVVATVATAVVVVGTVVVPNVKPLPLLLPLLVGAAKLNVAAVTAAGAEVVVDVAAAGTVAENEEMAVEDGAKPPKVNCGAAEEEVVVAFDG